MVTFKSNNVEIGSDEIRVEVELPDGDSILITLTHEGIITDCFRDGENIATSSITYDERFEEMTKGA